MSNIPGSTITVIGIGNEFRSDDAAGVIVARRMMNHAIPGIQICEASGEGTALMDLWRHRDEVILIDAVSSGVTPGTVHRYRPIEESLPVGLFPFSSHVFGLTEAIEVSRALHELPARMTIYGIEGRTFEMGTTLSTEVWNAVDEVTDLVLTHISVAHGSAVERKSR